jgi:hypothetical protein
MIVGEVRLESKGEMSPYVEFQPAPESIEVGLVGFLSGRNDMIYDQRRDRVGLESRAPGERRDWAGRRTSQFENDATENPDRPGRFESSRRRGQQVGNQVEPNPWLPVRLAVRRVRSARMPAACQLHCISALSNCVIEPGGYPIGQPHARLEVKPRRRKVDAWLHDARVSPIGVLAANIVLLTKRVGGRN